MRLTRGRVLEAPPGPGSDGPASGPPTRRVLPAELVRAHAEAEAVVAEAQKRAEAIVAEAQKRAASARAEAEREGRGEGAAALAAAWLRLRSAEARELRAREEQVLTLGRLLAERLLGRALSLEPALMVDLTREALAAVVRARRVALHVHPDDAETLRRHLGELGLDAATIAVHPDPARPRGGLRAETDLGTLDAELAPQLDRLVAALRRG
ncbi:MAG TPA: FliH/SctL family protein [Polyangiaceae bacterium]|nr:FliH/SctL family protein [Polyangiaceae bacterium]